MTEAVKSSWGRGGVLKDNKEGRGVRYITGVWLGGNTP